MSANIKITGDFKSVKSGFKELEKAVEDVGKKKVGINLDKATINNAREVVKKVFKDIEESNKSLTNEVNKLGKELEKAVDPKKIRELRKEVVALGREIASNNRALGSSAGGAFEGGGGASSSGGGFGGGGIFGKGGGIGKLVKGGAIGAAVMAGIGMATKVFSPAMQAASGRLDLRSLGLSSAGISNLERTGAGYGKSYEESRQLAGNLLRLTGSASSTGDVQRLSMMSGIGGDDIAGAMGGMRRSGMSSSQSVKMLKDVYTEAIAAGFDESRIADVMKAMSDNVESLAQNGANPLAIKEIMMGLMNSSSFFRDDASRAGQVLQSVDGKFAGGGAGAALSYRTLRGMGGQFSKMSSIQLIEQAGMGISGMGGVGKDGFNAYLEQIISQALGKKFKIGDKLNEDERSTVSVAGFRDFLGLAPNAAKELSYAVQNGNPADIGNKLLDATKSSEEKMQDLLTDSNTELLKISANIDAIKVELSTAMTPLLKGLDGNLSEILQGLKPVLDTIGGGASAANSFISSGGSDFSPTNLIKRAWRGMFSKPEDFKFVSNPALGPAGAGGSGGGAGSGLNIPLFAASGVDTSLLDFKSKSIRSAFDKMNPHSQSLAVWASKQAGIRQTITSAFRTKAENSALGDASPTSGHLTGDDFDVRVSDLSKEQVQKLIETYNSYSGVSASVHGGDHIHVSNRSEARKNKKMIAGTNAGPSVVSGANIKPEEDQLKEAINAFTNQINKVVDKTMIYPSRVYGFSGVKKMKE